VDSIGKISSSLCAARGGPSKENANSFIFGGRCPFFTVLCYYISYRLVMGRKPYTFMWSAISRELEISSFLFLYLFSISYERVKKGWTLLLASRLITLNPYAAHVIVQVGWTKDRPQNLP